MLAGAVFLFVLGVYGAYCWLRLCAIDGEDSQ